MSRRRRSDPEVERPLHRVPAASRRGNRVFYVAVEGGSTEPDYLGFLNRELGSELRFLIHPLYRSNGMTPTRVVARALEQRDEIRHGSGLVQLWAIFDRDQHHDILQAMRDAEAGGVTVAFSHPSFELWLLLHFSDFSGQQGGSSRVIHGKLRGQAGFETFGARNDKSLHGLRVLAINGKQEAAVKRAKRLVEDCSTGECSASKGHAAHCDPLRRDPSTDMWRLLVELGIVSV
ncbi:MAG TPA: RloB family protein [Micromonosporaceae bacterium]|nr:RloB family protein [Micromonosporaceae bacterium]